MYRKLNSNQPTCRICFEKRNLGSFFMAWFLFDEVLCETCRKNMNGHWKTIHRLGMEIACLYTYEDFARDILLRFKDGHDKWLNDVFLSPFLMKFYFKYRGHVIVSVPSHISTTKERGYIPNLEVLKTQKLEVIKDAIIKKHPYKQSTMHRDVRSNVSAVMKLKDIKQIQGKKILLFDDLCTTGHSLKAVYDLIKPYALSIQVFALFHHRI